MSLRRNLNFLSGILLQFLCVLINDHHEIEAIPLTKGPGQRFEALCGSGSISSIDLPGEPSLHSLFESVTFPALKVAVLLVVSGGLVLPAGVVAAVISFHLGGLSTSYAPTYSWGESGFCCGIPVADVKAKYLIRSPH